MLDSDPYTLESASVRRGYKLDTHACALARKTHVTRTHVTKARTHIHRLGFFSLSADGRARPTLPTLAAGADDEQECTSVRGRGAGRCGGSGCCEQELLRGLRREEEKQRSRRRRSPRKRRRRRPAPRDAPRLFSPSPRIKAAGFDLPGCIRSGTRVCRENAHRTRNKNKKRTQQRAAHRCRPLH